MSRASRYAWLQFSFLGAGMPMRRTSASLSRISFMSELELLAAKYPLWAPTILKPG